MSDDQRPWRCPRDETCGARYDTHDTASAYRHGCRSRAAEHANRRYKKAHDIGIAPARWVPALGTQRRIQALAVMGYTQRHIAAAAGLHTQVFGRILTARQVHVDTAATFARTYDQLAMTLGPSERARSMARTKGWAGPLAWDDIDDPRERAKTGTHRPTVGRRERVDHSADVARLTRAGRTAAQIAEQLHTTPRTVVRIRARLARQQEEAA